MSKTLFWHMQFCDVYLFIVQLIYSQLLRHLQQSALLLNHVNYLIAWGLIICHKFESYHYLHYNNIWLKQHSFGTHCCLVCFCQDQG